MYIQNSYTHIHIAIVWLCYDNVKVHTSPASKRGQDTRSFCSSAAIYHDYDITMA